MGEGRGWTPNTLQVHTQTHTLRGGLYPSSAPCSATPRDPPSPGPRPHYAAGPEAWGGGRGGVVTPRGAAEGWRGSAPQPGVLPGPAHSGSELRWASEGASSPFVPYLSAPLANTLCEQSVPQLVQPLRGLARGEGALFAILPTRRAVGTERGAATGVGRPTTGTLRLRRQVGVSRGDDRLTACPWQPEDGEASRAGSLKRCAALGDPWP